MSALNESIQIGVLLSQHGQMAIHEIAHLQGTLLGLAEVNAAGGVLGKKLVPVITDPASSPTRSRQLAEQLIVREHISHLFGCSDSGIRKSLIPLVERHNALLWYPTQFEGFEYSPNIIYGGACANQHVVPLFEHLMAGGHESFVLLGSDYIFPRETNRVVRELVEAAGGCIVEERYIPLVGTDTDVRRALETFPRADAIFSTVIGPCGLIAYAMLRAQGIHSPIASIGACELELSVAPDVLEGHICAAPYFESIGDDANSRFLGAFHRRFGDKARANWFTVNSFMQVLLFAQAAERAGSVEVEDIVQTIGIGEIEAPFGRCRVDAETNYTYCRSRIGVANGRGHFDIVYDAADALRPDPFLVGYA